MSRAASSYRDPEGFVSIEDERVFRYMDSKAYKDFLDANQEGFLNRLVQEKKLVPWQSKDIQLEKTGPYNNVVQLHRLSFISYPYEWSFQALKKAAIFHLDIQIEGLENNVVLSDATAYNVQFVGTEPIFIDHQSFKPYSDGEFWKGHGQFCEQFLNPLLLSAEVGIDYNGIYQANVDGIASELLLKVLPFYKKLKPALLMHLVVPHSMSTKRTVAKKTQTRKFSKNSYLALLKTLRSTIDGLKPKIKGTFWSGYADCNNYQDSSFQEKEKFISDFVQKTQPPILWDLGCNNGYFSILAAKNGARSVMSFDFDLECLDNLFLKAEELNLNIQPLLFNLSKPSPNIGWQQQERQGIFERRNATSLLALALIHHMRISSNIPLDQIVGYLTKLAPSGVIEFVPKTDSKVQELLMLREDIFFDYEQQNFEQLLLSKAKIIERCKINNSDRTLYWYDTR